jgi:streptogramin lyase
MTASRIPSSWVRRTFLAAALFGLVALQAYAADTYRISTVAGNGKPGYSGDGGEATTAMLNFRGSFGLLVDSARNIYIADGGNNRIRKVDWTGRITTVAGNGEPGFSGDDGPATKASLYMPTSVDMDRDGNLYIADSGNFRIRRIDASGIITTIAGTGGQQSTGDGGAATEADLSPAGIRFDSAGNLYVTDRTVNVIRRIDTKGIITTVAGTGEKGDTGDGGPAIKAKLNTPGDLCVDTRGNLYFTESDSNRIRKIDAAGIITTVAGPKGKGVSQDGLPATKEYLFSPSGICVDPDGNIYIAEFGVHRIRKVDTKGIIWTIAGQMSKSGYSGDGGPALGAMLSYPRGVRLGVDGSIYFLDRGNDVVRKLSRK